MKNKINRKLAGSFMFVCLLSSLFLVTRVFAISQPAEAIISKNLAEYRANLKTYQDNLNQQKNDQIRQEYLQNLLRNKKNVLLEIVKEFKQKNIRLKNAANKYFDIGSQFRQEINQEIAVKSVGLDGLINKIKLATSQQELNNIALDLREKQKDDSQLKLKRIILLANIETHENLLSKQIEKRLAAFKLQAQALEKRGKNLEAANKYLFSAQSKINQLKKEMAVIKESVLQEEVAKLNFSSYQKQLNDLDQDIKDVFQDLTKFLLAIKNN